MIGEDSSSARGVSPYFALRENKLNLKPMDGGRPDQRGHPAYAPVDQLPRAENASFANQE